MALLAIIVELIALYILSRRLTQNLYTAFFLLTRSRPVSIGIISFLFFPGTVLHELAHLFTAEVLGVRTAGLTLVPEGLEQRDVRTGSVLIAKSDPIRRAAIGVAPVFVGLITLGTISYFIPQLWVAMQLDAQNGILFSQFPLYGFLLSLYALFAVSNTMFASPEDLDGFWPVVIVLTLFAAAAYIAGIRLTLTESVLLNIQEFLKLVATNVGYVTILNIALFLCSKLLIRIAETVTGKRLQS